ncbi:hypothetical protein ASPBRDRAFT_68546 [Aspergillus brasiliensis CBS 101740]|uniref:C2H2-type domain-containing protein n=1 Tax=Aspergillus brasiliensis (strain CBS 101740 / IMI 381727 / IBT 21946) TaxID=767769 RepID=A0A1L9U810_ASPBC|nr:hypothetical protein ASPBRDRAFT_68546 [Aspergillus brasiliensis CBS 101740]
MQPEVRKRFACSFCDAKFARKEHKLRHEQSHPDTPRSSFKCSSCPRAFIRKDVLTRHERCVHRILKPSHRQRASMVQASQIQETRTHQSQESQTFQTDRLSATDTNSAQTTEPLRPVVGMMAEMETQLQSSGGPSRSLTWDYSNIDIYSDFFGSNDTLLPDGDYNLLPNQNRTRETEGDNNEVALNVAGTVNSIMSTMYNNISASDGAAGDQVHAAGFPIWNSGPTHVNPSMMDSVAIRYPTLNPSDLPSPPSSEYMSCETSMKLLELVENSNEDQSKLPAQLLLDDTVMVRLRDATGRRSQPKNRSLPAKVKCQRYIRSFFQHFHVHMPLMHVPTFQVCTSPSALLLSMLAIGALYSFDPVEARALHDLSKSTLDTDEGSKKQTVLLQTLLFITCFIYGSDDATLRSDGLKFQARLARELRTTREDLCSSKCQDWESWVEAEARKRAIINTTIFLGLMSVSSISDEISVPGDFEFEMPYDEPLWLCPNAEAWKSLHSLMQVPKSFKTAFHALLYAPEPLCTTPSVLGHLTLMHALWAHVRRSRYTAMALPSQLATQVLQSAANALRRWILSVKELWVACEEASRANPSLIALGIVLWEVTCVHLYADTPALANAKAITLGLVEDAQNVNPLLVRTQRSSHMTIAAKHSLVFLRGPISRGIHLMRITGSINVNPGHCLLGYHCVVLLVGWLYTVEYDTQRGAKCNTEEQALLDAVASLIEDSGIENIHLLPPSKAVATVWSDVLNAPSRIWGVEKLLGRYLATSISTSS